MFVGFEAAPLTRRLVCRVQEKPLLGQQPSPDDDGWAGWGDTWGTGTGTGTGGTKTKASPDQWGSWSNESPSPTTVEKSDSKKEVDDDNWSTDNWGSSFSSPASKKPAKTSGKSRTSGKKNEPDLANLIDLGGSTEAGTGDNDGWDNEVWAQDDDDDVWKTLELDSGSKTKQKGASKKGE